MRLIPNPQALSSWAHRHGLVSRDGDMGYALHALLTEAFGPLAPKPFDYRGGHAGLPGYTPADPNALRDGAALAPPDVARALQLDSLDARPYPDAWRPGQRLGFEIRTRPVIRAKGGREWDVYLSSQTSPSNETAQPDGQTEDRQTVYGHWLDEQFTAQNAADILQLSMEAFRLTRVIRKPQKLGTEKRPTIQINGPDVRLQGVLQIRDSAAFQTLLSRGIGRHRAFGFGMLLLRPPPLC